MFSLALIALTGCGSSAYTYSGYWSADHFPLSGNITWEYQNEGEDYLMKVQTVSTETIGDDNVVTLNYVNQDTSSLIYAIKWSADAGESIRLHGYKVESEMGDQGQDDSGGADAGIDTVAGEWVNFDPPLNLTEAQGVPGDVIKSTGNGVQFTSTFDAYEACPNLWTQDWECLKLVIESDEVSPAPFVGTWHLATEYGTSLFQPANASYPWRLTTYDWKEAG
jgi:hypothetical protein